MILLIPFFGLIAILLLIFFWFRIYNKRGFSGIVTVDFTLFFGLGWLLYTFFYILEKFLKNNLTQIDIQFIIDSIVALSFLIFGSLFAQYYLSTLRTKKREFSFSNNIIYLKTGTFIFITVLISLLLNYFVFNVFGGWNIYFNQTYGKYIESGINSLTSFIPFVLVSFILTFNGPDIKLTRLNQKLALLISVIFFLIFFMGGNRNIAMMMLISLIWATFYQRKINVFYLFPIITIIMVVGAVNAIGRNYGLINFLKGDVTIDNKIIGNFILSVSEGEFGTMARVSQYYNEINFNFNYFPGYTYVIEPIINLIPTIFYPDRPQTIAVEFTKQYSGGLDFGTIGLGFSPIVEAKINFGSFWFIVFGFLGSLLMILKKSTSKLTNNNRGYYIFGALSAISLNFFRIDFALTIKFFLIVLFFSYFLRYISKNLNRFAL